jgi:hypothetical protein
VGIFVLMIRIDDTNHTSTIPVPKSRRVLQNYAFYCRNLFCVHLLLLQARKKNHFAFEREKFWLHFYFFDTTSFYSKSAKVLKMLI